MCCLVSERKFSLILKVMVVSYWIQMILKLLRSKCMIIVFQSIWIKWNNLYLPVIGSLDDLCDAFQLGKMHKKSFQATNVTRAKSKLEFVHTDLCGPIYEHTFSKPKQVFYLICWWFYKNDMGVFFIKQNLNF